MMTDFYKSHSAQKPAEIDTTSSNVYVYQRKNFQKFSSQNLNGESQEFWSYDERKLTKTEYAQIRIAELESENTQLQLALTELYETLLED